MGPVNFIISFGVEFGFVIICQTMGSSEFSVDYCTKTCRLYVWRKAITYWVQKDTWWTVDCLYVAVQLHVGYWILPDIILIDHVTNSGDKDLYS